MVRRHFNLALFLIVAGALAGVGCGGGGSDETTAPTATTDEPTAITKGELISKGDSFCAEVNAAVGTIDASVSTDDAVRNSQKSQIYSGLAGDLKKLGKPSDAAAPKDVINAADALANKVAGGGDASADTSALMTAAAQYGFSSCAEPPAAPAGTGSTGSGGSDTSPAPSTPAPATTPEPAPAPATPPAGTGGGASPDTAGSGGGSSGGSSGGISP